MTNNTDAWLQRAKEILAGGFNAPEAIPFAASVLAAPYGPRSAQLAAFNNRMDEIARVKASATYERQGYRPEQERIKTMQTLPRSGFGSGVVGAVQNPPAQPEKLSDPRLIKLSNIDLKDPDSNRRCAGLLSERVRLNE